MAVQPDGKIVAVGRSYYYSGSDIVLARYNTDGSLDAGFGAGGKVTTNISTYSEAFALAVQPDGRILVAGYGGYATSDFALIRYTAQGILDGSFGVGGVALTDFGGTQDIAYTLSVLTDGKILVAGTVTPGGLVLVRYTATGTVDSTFGSGGRVMISPDQTPTPWRQTWPSRRMEKFWWQDG